jgi:hypothetical protein
MFPRVAKNFAVNGYYPTDEVTLSRCLAALEPASTGRMRIFDPCAGEGVAIAEAAHALGRERVESFAVEINPERFELAQNLTDCSIRGDLMDTLISAQSFGLLFLNPPYGDLPKFSHTGDYEGTGRKRLEKLFYQQSLPTLQFGGILILIVPNYAMDEEFSNWVARQFADVRVFRAPEKRFKQIVVFGRRVRSVERAAAGEIKAVAQRLFEAGTDLMKAPELPEEWSFEPYTVPAPTRPDVEKFYRVSIEPEQLASEVKRCHDETLWPKFDELFNTSAWAEPRRPVRELSKWHQALGVAAGVISGPIKSETGKLWVIKGRTYKDHRKNVSTEFDPETERSRETTTTTDVFVAEICAWDMTPGSPTFGQLLTIRSEPQIPGDDLSKDRLFDMGQLYWRPDVGRLANKGVFNPYDFLARFKTGDWGDSSDSERRDNDHAVKDGLRIRAIYDLPDTGTFDGHQTLEIITEADRSQTMIQFAD